MTRSFWIKAHLIAASFFAPALLITAISGGLYLINIKGTVEESAVDVPADVRLDMKSETLEQDVRSLLEDVGIEHDFEYLRAGGNTIYTRPTSRTYYVLKVSPGAVTMDRHIPDLQKTMIELHKGHGPRLYKDFQKVMAGALLFILLSGAWLGISSIGLRMKTGLTIGAGALVFLGLVFLA